MIGNTGPVDRPVTSTFTETSGVQLILNIAVSAVVQLLLIKSFTLEGVSSGQLIPGTRESCRCDGAWDKLV